MQVWPCFEDFIIIKIMVQFKFNLDARFNSYSFFQFRSTCMQMMLALFVNLCMHAQILYNLPGNVLKQSIHHVRLSNGFGPAAGKQSDSGDGSHKQLTPPVLVIFNFLLLNILLQQVQHLLTIHLTFLINQFNMLSDNVGTVYLECEVVYLNC